MGRTPSNGELVSQSREGHTVTPRSVVNGQTVVTQWRLQCTANRRAEMWSVNHAITATQWWSWRSRWPISEQCKRSAHLARLRPPGKTVGGLL